LCCVQMRNVLPWSPSSAWCCHEHRILLTRVYHNYRQ
jgi:hypothetical protein